MTHRSAKLTPAARLTIIEWLPEVWTQAQAASAMEVLSDNGGNYRSGAFHREAQALGIPLRRTRPRRPQTNGKAEAYSKTMQREWAYRRQ